MFIGLNRKKALRGLKIGRGNPRETEESEKRVKEKQEQNETVS